MKKNASRRNAEMRLFRAVVWNYARIHRRLLPWRPPSIRVRRDGSLDPYRILVSEIMLQQTQVGRAIPKYKKFITTFPNLESLGRASLQSVLVAWQGLGYNRRAIFLKRASEIILRNYHGEVPRSRAELLKLPGVGENTAGAILAFAFNAPAVFIETNIRTVFLHHFFKKKKRVSDKEIVPLIKKTLPAGRQAREWYYALMDYGAHLKKTVGNANRRSAHYRKQSRFKGSHRELRGKVVKIITRTSAPLAHLADTTGESLARIRSVVSDLEREGFAIQRNGRVFTAEARHPQ